MSLGNGNAKASNKGSNYSYELKTLKVLNAINATGATEATLQALLAAVEASKDYEVRIVNDSNPGGEVTFLEVRYWNAYDGTLGSPVYYLPGSDTPYNIGDPGGPVAPLTYSESSGGSAAITNIIDTNNSTNTPLGAGAVFPGTGTDVSAFNSVTIQLFADEDSAANGMSFQFSPDNVNWDEQNDYNLEVSISQTRRFQFPVTARYFRVVYTNGGTAQTAFRVQTILHTSDVLTSIHRLDTGLTNDRSVTVTKSVIAGETSAGGGAFVNVKVAPSGSLETNASQDTHDDLNTNANIQVGDIDVSGANPVPTQETVQTVTPNLIRTTGAGTIPAGARSFSIANVGAADGDILGGTNNIKTGEVINFDAGLNNTYGAVAYDATGTELLITYNN
jgi:hypothetical protein